MTVFYYHYTPDYATALQANFSGAPDYYKELNKCTIYPSWCAFNAVSNETAKDWHPADYRQYNFPHQIAPYYALYLAARELDLLGPSLSRPWEWYLEMAAKTLLALGCCEQQPGSLPQCLCYPTVGLMDGTVFREVLIALQQEAAEARATADKHPPRTAASPVDWASYATLAEYMLRLRVFGGEGSSGGVPWVDQDAPYGSEFNWDTTGQEEVGVWGAFFNATNETLGELHLRAVDSILAFMPSTPNFAYHGSAGGWGDFSNNGKWLIQGGWEREGGHYRAGLNSIPLAERFRSHPDQLYLLEVAMGGMTGVLANIDAEGASSMAFHLYPFMLAYDPHTGDHGLGFFGHSLNVGAYLVEHPNFGPLCYLCIRHDVSDDAAGERNAYAIDPVDSYRRRAYLADLGLWLVLRSGQQLERLTVRKGERTLIATLVPPPAGWLSSKVRLQLDTPALPTGRRSPHGFGMVGGTLVRGAWELAIPIGQAAGRFNVTVTWQS